ncbi:MAG: hypothetical protein SFY96_07470 [Planctomycetota bacterium]|nr:hypothetical protein [Planctomycetota bacterium]
MSIRSTPSTAVRLSAHRPGLSKHRLAGLVAGLVLAFAAPAAVAQLQTLPPEVITAQGSLAPDQRTLVEKFVADAAKGLSGDAKAIREARVTLVTPLTQPQVGVLFRTTYSEQLAKILPDLVNAGGTKGINALIIAGETATARMFDLAEEQLAARETAMRFAAVSSLGAGFEQARTRTPGVPVERIRTAVTKLATRLGTETDSFVVDAITRSILSAARNSQTGYESLREFALDALVKGMADRLASATTITNDDAAMLQALLRAGLAARDELAVDERNRGVAGGISRLSSAAVKDLATLGGEMLALSARLIKDPDLNPAADAEDVIRERAKKSRALIGQIAGTAQAIITLAGSALQSTFTNPAGANLATVATEGKNESDARFLTTVADLVGPGGLLSKQPFEITRTFKLP